MNAIEIKRLTKRYGENTAVDSLSLTVEEGSLLALLGVNGAGKTTTVKMLSGLTEPTEGEVLLLGKSLREEPLSAKALIGVSPQETAVARGLSVYENLDLICGVHGFSKEKRKRKIEEIVSLFSLQEVLRKKAGKLSGGWQRRLSIAMAWITEPKILFLDEPTLGLDVLAASDLRDLICSLKGRVTILLTTHYMKEAEELADRIAIMKNGRLLRCDSLQKILEDTGAEDLERAFVRIVKGTEG